MEHTVSKMHWKTIQPVLEDLGLLSRYRYYHVKLISGHDLETKSCEIFKTVYMC